jgi:uncharacterized membrane protein YgaE (UPF0421/DUF939 family)
MKVRFCINDIIEYYNIYDHNTAFSAARKQEILREISAMVEDNKRKEKMYYHLQHGLLDIKDDHIPDDGIGAFLTDLNEVKQYVQREWREYNARTQHYERLYQIVEVLEVLPDDHTAKYKKMDEAEEQQRKKTDSDPNKDDRKRKAL